MGFIVWILYTIYCIAIKCHHLLLTKQRVRASHWIVIVVINTFQRATSYCILTDMFNCKNKSISEGVVQRQHTCCEGLIILFISCQGAWRLNSGAMVKGLVFWWVQMFPVPQWWARQNKREADEVINTVGALLGSGVTSVDQFEVQQFNLHVEKRSKAFLFTSVGSNFVSFFFFLFCWVFQLCMFTFSMLKTWNLFWNDK